MGEDKFVVVHRPLDEVTANIMKNVLETAGIPAIVRPYHSSWFDGVLVPADGAWGDLLVREEHAEEARVILSANAETAVEEEGQDESP